LRLQKTFHVFGGSEFVLSAEVFNLFNEHIWASGDSFFNVGETIQFRGDGHVGEGNALAGPPRTVQFGAAFRF
jgi:hypothetical protein